MDQTMELAFKIPALPQRGTISEMQKPKEKKTKKEEHFCFTRIPNKVLEKLAMITLTESSRKVLAVIERKTLGFNKPKTSISLKEFQELAVLSRSSVCRALMKLRSGGIVSIERGGPKGWTETIYEIEIDPSKSP